MRCSSASELPLPLEKIIIIDIKQNILFILILLGLTYPPSRMNITNMKAIAQIFKALSDETRLRILALLTRGELCVCDLMAVLRLPQSTVSRHLAYLRNAGLISDRREGVWMYYRLEEQLKAIEGKSWASLLAQLLKQQQADADLAELNQYLADKEGSRCG